MKYQIDGVVWTVDEKRKAIEARIHGIRVRVNKTLLYLDPERTFQVWLNGTPATSLGIFPYFSTADNAAKFLSSLRRKDWAIKAERAVEGVDRADTDEGKLYMGLYGGA